MGDLRKKLIRLAHEKPELRGDLRPLLKQAGKTSGRARGTIYVTQKDNDELFDQKLPTWSRGFTEITRSITLTPHPDPDSGFDWYGFFKVRGKKIPVESMDGKEWQFDDYNMPPGARKR